ARGIRTGGGCSGPHSRVEAQFSDIDVPNTINKDLTRPGHIRPLRKVRPVRREKLKAAVFAVSHVHSSLPINSNAVRQAELTRAISRLPPGKEQLAVRRNLV